MPSESKIIVIAGQKRGGEDHVRSGVPAVRARLSDSRQRRFACFDQIADEVGGLAEPDSSTAARESPLPGSGAWRSRCPGRSRDASRRRRWVRPARHRRRGRCNRRMPAPAASVWRRLAAPRSRSARGSWWSGKRAARRSALDGTGLGRRPGLPRVRMRPPRCRGPQPRSAAWRRAAPSPRAVPQLQHAPQLAVRRTELGEQLRGHLPHRLAVAGGLLDLKRLDRRTRRRVVAAISRLAG